MKKRYMEPELQSLEILDVIVTSGFDQDEPIGGGEEP